MCSILSFDIISVVVPDPKIFLCNPAQANAAAVNPNETNTLLANSLITFFFNGSHVFNNGPRSIPRNPPDCIILDNLLFESLVSVDKLFVKALQRFATCVLVNNNSYRKLILSSELPIIFDDNLKTTCFIFYCRL